MAALFMARHCSSANGAVRLRRDRRSHGKLAVDGLETGHQCPRETARLFEVSAHQRSQGDGSRVDRISALSTRVLSGGTDVVQSGRAGTRPSVSAGSMEQPRRHSVHCRNPRHSLDDVLCDQRRVYGRILDALPSRLHRENLSAFRRLAACLVTQSDLTPLLRNGPSLFERNQFETLSFGFRAYFDLLTLLIAQPIGGETTVVEFLACGDQVERIRASSGRPL